MEKVSPMLHREYFQCSSLIASLRTHKDPSLAYRVSCKLLGKERIHAVLSSIVISAAELSRSLEKYDSSDGRHPITEADLRCVYRALMVRDLSQSASNLKQMKQTRRKRSKTMVIPKLMAELAKRLAAKKQGLETESEDERDERKGDSFPILSRLPSSLMEYVCSFLSLHDCRTNLALVNKEWMRLFHDHRKRAHLMPSITLGSRKMSTLLFINPRCPQLFRAVPFTRSLSLVICESNPSGIRGNERSQLITLLNLMYFLTAATRLRKLEVVSPHARRLMYGENETMRGKKAGGSSDASLLHRMLFDSHWTRPDQFEEEKEERKEQSAGDEGPPLPPGLLDTMMLHRLKQARKLDLNLPCGMDSPLSIVHSFSLSVLIIDFSGQSSWPWTLTPSRSGRIDWRRNIGRFIDGLFLPCLRELRFRNVICESPEPLKNFLVESCGKTNRKLEVFEWSTMDFRGDTPADFITALNSAVIFWMLKNPMLEAKLESQLQSREEEWITRRKSMIRRQAAEEHALGAAEHADDPTIETAVGMQHLREVVLPFGVSGMSLTVMLNNRERLSQLQYLNLIEGTDWNEVRWQSVSELKQLRRLDIAHFGSENVWPPFHSDPVSKFEQNLFASSILYHICKVGRSLERLFLCTDNLRHSRNQRRLRQSDRRHTPPMPPILAADESTVMLLRDTFLDCCNLTRLEFTFYRIAALDLRCLFVDIVGQSTVELIHRGKDAPKLEEIVVGLHRFNEALFFELEMQSMIVDCFSLIPSLQWFHVYELDKRTMVSHTMRAEMDRSFFESGLWWSNNWSG